MIFLIEYSRIEGRLVNFEKFEERDREKAADARLAIELALNKKGLKHEVVLLEAEDEAALLLTHRRYFEDAKQIVISSTG